MRYDLTPAEERVLDKDEALVKKREIEKKYKLKQNEQEHKNRQIIEAIVRIKEVTVRMTNETNNDKERAKDHNTFTPSSIRKLGYKYVQESPLHMSTLLIMYGVIYSKEDDPPLMQQQYSSSPYKSEWGIGCSQIGHSLKLL